MKPRILLFMGDPSGIGPEIVVKLLSRTEERLATNVLVMGERWSFEDAQRTAGVKIEVPSIDSLDHLEDVGLAFLETNFLQRSELVPGHASIEAGTAVIKSIKLSVELATRGLINAICYAPLNKQAMHMAGLQFPDELRLFARELGHTGVAGEVNVLGKAWTSRVTSHVPISDVSRLITVESIQQAIGLIHQTIVKSGTNAPRIAVAALNPHAGDGGNFGREEIDLILPAILGAAASGIDICGPFPSDTVFLKLRDGSFDGVVTMYHDQGQIAMKLMGFQRGVTVSGGLPIAITTPAHGTAFDIVGTGQADAGAMVEAFRIAIRLTAGPQSN